MCAHGSWMDPTMDLLVPGRGGEESSITQRRLFDALLHHARIAYQTVW